MRFSIRDLLLVTMIVAVCVAWWLDHRRLSERLRTIDEDAKVREKFNALSS